VTSGKAMKLQRIRVKPIRKSFLINLSYSQFVRGRASGATASEAVFLAIVKTGGEKRNCSGANFMPQLAKAAFFNRLNSLRKECK
jgi:hypothetical protein